MVDRGSATSLPRDCALDGAAQIEYSFGVVGGPIESLLERRNHPARQVGIASQRRGIVAAEQQPHVRERLAWHVLDVNLSIRFGRALLENRDRRKLALDQAFDVGKV